MSVTESDQNGQATMTVASGAADAPDDLQDARTRARPDRTPGSANQPVTQGDAPWSMRAGNGIRKGASATISHPRTWGIWDQHPASLRVICKRRADSACQHPSVLVRWPANAGWAFVIAWAAVFTLVAVAPRNKTCWILAAVAVIVWLTWRH